MKTIPDKSIDMILCDLPYGTTACKWDNMICLNCLWREYKRIIKDKGVIALFGSEPFSSSLRMSNLKMFKYDWIWEKPQGANFLLCKYQPYKVHEIISIFSKTTHNYYPQMTRGKKYISGSGDSGEITRNVKKIQTVNQGTRYPRSILQFSINKNKSLHPTQKPVELLEYLIKTYTNENDLVLDNCMGSGSTCIASLNTNRKFIGIELEKKYFDISYNRIKEKINNPCFNCSFKCDSEDKKQCSDYKKGIKENE